MSDILDVIIAVVIVLAVSLGIWSADMHFFHISQNENLAQKTAYFWEEYSNALNSYVLANQNSAIPEQVTCSMLQSAGYLSTGFGGGNCTDPIGETLTGYVSSPWGFPQSWLVVASSLPNTGILAKNDINNQVKWQYFTAAVAADASGATGATLNNNNFQIVNSNQPAGNLDDYFPASGVPDPMSAPVLTEYDNYGIMFTPALSLNPGYWLWTVTAEANIGASSNISFQNLGYSAICPTGGITPAPNTTNWAIVLLNTANYMTDNNDANFSNTYYLCFPASKNIINNNLSYNPFPSVSSTNVYNYDSNQENCTPNNPCTDGEPFGGSFSDSGNSNTVPPQVSSFDEITVGNNVYTLVDYIGGANGLLYNSALNMYPFNVAVLWQGRPTNINDVTMQANIYSGAIYATAPFWPVSEVNGENNIALN